MVTFRSHPFDDDKLKEECGIFGVVGVADASTFVALGLHALQHRGQEAGGIVSYHPEQFSRIRFPWDIPIEDFGFGFALITAGVILWEVLGRRELRAES